MPAIPLSDVQKKAAVSIGRAHWIAQFKRQYPQATKEQKLESWKASRRDYVRLGGLAVRRMLKDGIKVSA